MPIFSSHDYSVFNHRLYIHLYNLCSHENEGSDTSKNHVRDFEIN